MIRFTAINSYGNNFYLDNIQVNGQNILSTTELNNTKINISIYPNPSNGILNIRSDEKI